MAERRPQPPTCQQGALPGKRTSRWFDVLTADYEYDSPEKFVELVAVAVEAVFGGVVETVGLMHKQQPWLVKREPLDLLATCFY